MDKRSIYTIQPYRVGSKKGNSLALIIPCNVVKEHNINISTIFVLHIDEKTRNVILRTINEKGDIEKQKIFPEQFVSPDNQRIDRIQ